MSKETLKSLCNEYIAKVDKLYFLIKKHGYENEQFVLDFLDKLNEISVR